MVDKKDRPLNKPFKSTVKGKKFSVIVMSNGKRKQVNFGAKGMDDWRSGTATKEQRKSFRARMKGIKRKDGSYAYKDKTSPAYWALNYLW
jgi:predicted HAD superfamily phosphohydrolase YqeG